MKVILSYLKPHWKLCLITIILMMMEMVGALLVPTFAGEMINEGQISTTGFNTLLITTIKMMSVSLFASIGAIIGGYTCALLASRVGEDMRKDIYKKSLALSMYDFQTFSTASMVTRTISDISNIQVATVNVFQIVLPVPVIFIVSLILSFSLDWLIGLILLGVMLLITLVAIFIIKGASPLFKRLQKLLDNMSKVLLENITGVRVIRAFNKQDYETNRLNEAFSTYKVTSVKANIMFASLDGLSYFAINFFVILIYYLAGYRVSLGLFKLGDITAVIEYALLALFFIMMMEMVILTLPRAFECTSRFKEVLDYKVEIIDSVNKDIDIPHSDDVLIFDKVRFHYLDSEEYALDDISFTCKRGSTTAIIGGTGSGKSTIASLILRFSDVSKGSIKFNEINIKDISQKQLRDNLSYVQQKAWLFSGTIKDNLRLGNKGASEEEMWHALDIAQASQFVSKLEHKLDSYVAQGGTNFSGGQKQRISIARALIKKPELFIFDDSFSALDFKTDASLRHALKEETKDKAVLIIAQRVSSIKHADQIIVLNKGKIEGIGKHEELLINCPLYKEIYESQTKEVNE